MRFVDKRKCFSFRQLCIYFILHFILQYITFTLYYIYIPYYDFRNKEYKWAAFRSTTLIHRSNFEHYYNLMSCCVIILFLRGRRKVSDIGGVNEKKGHL